VGLPGLLLLLLLVYTRKSSRYSLRSSLIILPCCTVSRTGESTAAQVALFSGLLDRDVEVEDVDWHALKLQRVSVLEGLLLRPFFDNQTKND
jgi:hypothetical protein